MAGLPVFWLGTPGGGLLVPFTETRNNSRERQGQQVLTGGKGNTPSWKAPRVHSAALNCLPLVCSGGEGNGRIPGTGEPGGLPSMGSHRIGHD